MLALDPINAFIIFDGRVSFLCGGLFGRIRGNFRRGSASVRRGWERDSGKIGRGGAGVLNLVVVDFGRPRVFAFGGWPTFLVIFVGASLLKNRRSPPFPAYFSPSLVLKRLFGLGIAVAMASGGKPILYERERERILGLT